MTMNCMCLIRGPGCSTQHSHVQQQDSHCLTIQEDQEDYRESLPSNMPVHYLLSMREGGKVPLPTFSRWQRTYQLKNPATWHNHLKCTNTKLEYAQCHPNIYEEKHIHKPEFVHHHQWEYCQLLLKQELLESFLCWALKIESSADKVHIPQFSEFFHWVHPLSKSMESPNEFQTLARLE